MIALFVHEDAEADLEALWNQEPQTAASVLALLEQLEGDPDLLDRLTQHDYGACGTADFHVSKWFAQWNKGRDLWRLKIWDLEDRRLHYRVVYAFVPKKNHYHILAIAPREFNYDHRHHLTQRILDA